MAYFDEVTRQQRIARLMICGIYALLIWATLPAAASQPQIPKETNDASRAFHGQFKQRQMVQVRPGIYVAFAYGLANFTFIEGKTKIIVVDSGWFAHEMDAALKDLRKLTNKPIGAVIYTHAHPDHTGGTGLLADQITDVPIYAANGFAGSEWDNSGRQFEAHLRQAYTQLGLMLETAGEYPLGAGVGPTPKLGPRAYVAPNMFVTERQTLSIDGIDFTLIPAGMDVPEGLMVWIENHRVLLAGDTLTGVFTILETPRHSPARSPYLMARSFDIALALDPAAIIPGHGRLHLDAADARDVLTVNRNLSNFLIDQVDRLIDQGMGMEEIVHTIEIPPRLARHPDLQPFYHRADWIVRGLVARRMGWHTELMDLVREDGVHEARNLVAMVGVEHLGQEFDKAMVRGEYRWAVQIANWLQLSNGSAEGNKRYLAALIVLAAQTRSTNERSYILTEILEKERKIDWQKQLGQLRLDFARSLTTRALIDQLRMRTNPSLTTGLDITFLIKLVGSDEQFSLQLQDSTVLFALSDEQPDMTITLPRDRLNEFRSGYISWESLLQQSDVQVQGDLRTANLIFGNGNP